MKYKRRGRWEGYSIWLALGNGPIMAGTHCPGYERGYGVRASVTSQAAPSYPLVPLSSPESLVLPHSYLRLQASQRVGTETASALSRSLCRSMPQCCAPAGPRRYLHCSLNWVSSAVRRGNGHRSQVTSASRWHCLLSTSAWQKRIWEAVPQCPWGAVAAPVPAVPFELASCPGVASTAHLDCQKTSILSQPIA